MLLTATPISSACNLQISFDHHDEFAVQKRRHLLKFVNVSLHQRKLFIRFCKFKTIVSMLHMILCWLEKNVRVPLEGTAFDTLIASPLKHNYKNYRRLH